MRRKTGGRKSGSGGAGAVLKTGLRPGGKEEKEQKEKESSGISPLGARQTEESEAYYNNPNVSSHSFNRVVISVILSLIKKKGKRTL